jgi:hypothetical protein
MGVSRNATPACPSYGSHARDVAHLAIADRTISRGMPGAYCICMHVKTTDTWAEHTSNLLSPTFFDGRVEQLERARRLGANVDEELAILKADKAGR